MNDQHVLVDLLRVCDMAGAMWLGVLVLRLCWIRWRQPREGQATIHPFTYLAFSVALFSIAGFRIARLGKPPDHHLWVDTLVVVLGLIGVLSRVELGSPFALRLRHRLHVIKRDATADAKSGYSEERREAR